MKRKITIRDVAKHAGVSPASVSYAVNGKKKVSAETKQKILKAIQELNYRPDFTAVSLSSKKSKLIGIMKIWNEDSLLPVLQSNPYYNEFISGIESVTRTHGYDILLTGIENAEESEEWVHKRNLDGLVLMGSFPSVVQNLAETADIPIVLVDYYEGVSGNFHTMNIADEEGGYLATKHLLELGHTCIAMALTNISKSPVDHQRFLGYKRALKEFGVPFRESLVFDSVSNFFQSSLEAGNDILRSKQNITAVFSTSDTLSLGIMRTLSSNGMKIPEDFSIVGFDDLSVSQYLTPSLSTVRQDIFKKGQLTATMIFKAMEQGNSEPLKETLPVELIIRESSVARQTK
ncbi:LacI family DNA-binding transcriptional regulator [Metabacillus sp. RGM 3146]|uniref:LacI family DNA-binding transcriptional regulator n=1 Tax=Metabacillus sp. RGM 3146 TaxID=3401092 RepID=UPI003B9DC0E7